MPYTLLADAPPTQSKGYTLLPDAPQVDNSSFLDKFGRAISDQTSGFLHGAASEGMGLLHGATAIGNTLMQPVDAALNATGITTLTNKQRRQDTSDFFNEHSDPNSLTFKIGDLVSSMAGTAGVGGVLAKPLLAASKAGVAAPYLTKLANSVQSGGMTLGTKGGNAAVNAATRIGGGVATGAATAGLIDPDSIDMGAAIGGGIPVAGKVLGTAGKLVNAGYNSVKPLLKSGQNEILADLLLKKAGANPEDVINNLTNAQGNTAGFNPTVGQASNNADLATLERVMRDKNPQQLNVSNSQNGALANAIRGIGGDDVARQGLVTARNDAANVHYDAGKNAMVESNPQLEQLLQRPAIANAFNAAKTNALNSGRDGLVDDTILNGTLHQDGAPQQVNQFSRPDLLKGDQIGGGEGQNVIQTIRKMGGVNLSHIEDITGETTGRAARAPVGFFHRNGLGIDDLASQLHDSGYIPHEDMSVDGGVQYAKDMIREHLSGNKQFALGDEPYFAPDYYGTKTIEHNNPIKDDVGNFSVNPVYSGSTLQEVKFALDQAKKFNPSASTGERMTQKGVLNASNDYNQFLSDTVPDIRKGDAVFSEMSKPINSMDLGNKIADRYIPAMYRDVEVPHQLNHSNLAKDLYDNGNGLAKSVTGFGGATLENTLNPEHIQTIRNAVKDANYIKNGQLSGKPDNSSTYQNLAFNSNLNEQSLGSKLMKFAPLGIAGSVLKAGRDFIYKGANESLHDKLIHALLNPQETGKLMNSRLNATKNSKKLNELLTNPSLINAPIISSLSNN